MTKEEKQLLLQDLCARLPYGVICNTPKGDGHLCSINQTIFGTEYGINIKATERDYFNDREEVIKPYLRPMSSMTEEEIEIYRIIIKSLLENSVTNNVATLYNFLNSKHLDYNSLIYFGLAIEVTEENNPYKD